MCAIIAGAVASVYLSRKKLELRSQGSDLSPNIKTDHARDAKKIIEKMNRSFLLLELEEMKYDLTRD